MLPHVTPYKPIESMQTRNVQLARAKIQAYISVQPHPVPPADPPVRGMLIGYLVL
jgi:hypothetical protein